MRDQAPSAHAPARRLTALVLAVCVCASAAALGAAALGAAEPDDRAEPEMPTDPAELVEYMARDDFAGMAACRRLQAMGRRAVPHLIRGTRHNVPRVRYWSIAGLSGIGAEEGLPAVQERLADPDGTVRAVATWHLGRWWDRPEVRAQVVGMLQDRDPFVVRQAVLLVQQKRYAEAADGLLPLLESPDEDVRFHTVHTLALLKGAAALDAMRRTVREDESPIVRECALRACTILAPRTPAVGDVLIIGLRDGDETVRKVAVELLRKGFGRHFEFDPAGEPLQRETAVRRWRQWYEANADRLVWNAANSRFEVPGEPPVRDEPAPQPATDN